MRSKLVAIILIIFITIIFLHIETDTKIAINYEVNNNKIYLYKKIYNFINRHNQIQSAVNQILTNEIEIFSKKISENKILSINKWLLSNVNKIRDNEIVIDFHPTTIMDRSKGTSDQFNDLFSTLLVYAKFESFYKNIKFNNQTYPITFVKIDDYWTIIDPFNGLYFTTNNKFASIKNIKKNNFKINSINRLKNNEFIFFNKSLKYNELNIIINKILYNFDQNIEINNVNKYQRGGRSYFQDPINRLKYEFLKKFNLI